VIKRWHQFDKGTRLHVLCQMRGVYAQTPPRSSQRAAWQTLIDLAMFDEAQAHDVKERIGADDVKRLKLNDVIDTSDWEPRP
jgi:hypothetical protein